MLRTLFAISIRRSYCTDDPTKNIKRKQEAKYTNKNGPPLVTPGFIRRISKATKDGKFVADGFQISACNTDYFQLSKKKGKKNISYITTVYELPGDKFNILVADPNFKSLNDSYLPDMNKTYTRKELNRLIDEYYFPDLSTRAQKKREILNRIAELNKSK